MSSRSFEEAERAFHEARALPPAERSGWLADLRSRDAALAAEIEQLLELDDGESDLDGRAWGPSSRGTERRIGSWLLERRLATGGMGMVWLAHRDDESFGQRVALKILSPLLADTDFDRRFRVERSLLASLEHPNVARLVDGGVTDDQTVLPGLPYMAIEYVDGPPIDVYCREQELSLDERVQLFLQILDAVDAAHRAMILHRDLKPANILVESSSGTVKVLDFGVATLLAEGSPELGTSPALATGTGLFTPAYASPEQLLGRTLDTTSDVYSLGVVLYELAASKHPFAREGTGGLEAALARAERTPPTLEDPDLARVCAKAMTPEPAERYGSAREFADDLTRWLEGRPVLARPVGPLVRVIKFARRNPALSGALTLAVLGVLIAILGLTVGLQRAERARRATQASERVAQSRRAALLLLWESLESSFKQDLRTSPRDEPVLRRLILGMGMALDASDASPELRAVASIELSGALIRFDLYGAARTALEHALELEGQIPRRLLGEVRVQLAKLFSRTGEVAQAGKQIERVLAALEGELTGGEQGLLAEAYLERGKLALKAGAEEDALADFLRAQEFARGIPGDRTHQRDRIRDALRALKRPTKSPGR